MSDRIITNPNGFLQPYVSGSSDNEFTSGNTWNNKPVSEMKESERGYEILLAAPGFRQEDLHVTVENNALVVSAEAKFESADARSKPMRRNYVLKHTFPLNGLVTEADLMTKYENGMLSITLPKSAMPK